MMIRVPISRPAEVKMDFFLSLKVTASFYILVLSDSQRFYHSTHYTYAVGKAFVMKQKISDLLEGD
jgi:hypothetical protein